jgi:hypothetical protein
MPTYDFKNKETGEIFTKIMSMSAMDDFMKDNPDVERYYASAPAAVDPTRIGGVRKPDEGFRDVLKNIHSKHRGSKINTW